MGAILGPPMISGMGRLLGKNRVVTSNSGCILVEREEGIAHTCSVRALHMLAGGRIASAFHDFYNVLKTL